VVDHVKPVADVFPVAVYRQGLPLEGVVDDQGNELFRKLVGAVVVGTVGDQCRQAVGMKVGAHQVVGRGFAGRVRRPGIVGRGFLKGAGFAKRTVYFIGAHMQKSVFLAGGISVFQPGFPRRFEQGECAQDVGPDKFGGTRDAAVHVRFGGEMNNRVDLFFGKNLLHQVGIANVALHKTVTGRIFNIR